MIEDHKRQMVYARLSRRLRSLNLSSFDAYLDLIEGPNPGEEMQAFVNSVTTNLTSFFREGHHFEHLSEAVIAPMVARNERRLRIWSAGCSTGEEPHCIAMTILGACPMPPPEFKVLATDLDTKVLSVAESGTYPKDRLDSIPAEHRSRLTVAPDGESFTFKPEVRGLLHFRHLNLLSHWPMRGPFDVVFCRNVLIYFDAEFKARLIDGFADLLKPGGFLYLGHSESILGTHPKLKSLGRTIYERRA